MDKNNRVLLRVVIPTANTEEARDEAFETRRQVERLMGKDQLVFTISWFINIYF